MTDLTMSFDPGASLNKVVYQVRDEKTPNLLVMQPEVILVTHEAMKSYVSNRIGHPRPEAEAWGVVDNKCFVVGCLAREFLADAGMRELKYERAVYKVLAAVGAIKQILGLPTKFSVCLAVLLPWNEYPDRERFERLLRASLKNYTFRDERLRVKLEHFECRPEGSGLAMSRLSTKGLDWFRSRSIATLMFGHRNTSALVFIEGKLNHIHTTTTDLGFHQMVEMVVRRTSGQNADTLTKAIFSAGAAISETQSAIAGLAQSRDEHLKAEEVRVITSAIASSRTQYWRRLSAWLDTTLQPQLNVAEVILCGGAAHYFKKELQEYFSGTPTYWGDELMKQVQTTIFADHPNTTALAFRLLDGFGLFLYLQEREAAIV
jgi:hypothetical protein